MGFLQIIKKKFYSHYSRKHGLIHKPKFEEMPSPEIGFQHLQYGKLLASREQLLSLLTKNEVVAELDVDNGDFSRRILDIYQPSKLHLIDIWQSERYPEKLFHKVNQKFRAEVEGGVVEINRGLSTEVVNHFPAEYFDWIYIDTDHTYAGTKAELESYLPKMKKGGIIAGHDFIVSEINVPWKYGVIEAVYEFCIEHHWEFLYLTMERGITPSFAIKEIFQPSN
ncbi:MAG: class I SAM-dependent methyltransferase [Cyclobacteriaceae bacterium]